MKGDYHGYVHEMVRFLQETKTCLTHIEFDSFHIEQSDYKKLFENQPQVTHVKIWGEPSVALLNAMTDHLKLELIELERPKIDDENQIDIRYMTFFDLVPVKGN